MTDAAPDLGALYEDTRVRLLGLLESLDADEFAAPVPACPGWSVSDVVAHLAAVGEDVVAGRLAKPPTDEETAAQVARFDGMPLSEVVARWTEVVPAFEEVISGFSVWPAVLDIVSHEHDIRGAVGRPGGRDSDAVRAGSEQLVTWLRPPAPMRVVLEDAEYRVGPEGDGGLELRTTRFEAVRWRLGRRSRAQMASFAWSDDPAPVLDHLVIFGPASRDVIE